MYLICKPTLEPFSITIACYHFQTQSTSYCIFFFTILRFVALNKFIESESCHHFRHRLPSAFEFVQQNVERPRTQVRGGVHRHLPHELGRGVSDHMTVRAVLIAMAVILYRLYAVDLQRIFHVTWAHTAPDGHIPHRHRHRHRQIYRQTHTHQAHTFSAYSTHSHHNTASIQSFRCLSATPCRPSQRQCARRDRLKPAPTCARPKQHRLQTRFS